jgi:hypothetical protein
VVTVTRNYVNGSAYISQVSHYAGWVGAKWMCKWTSRWVDQCASKWVGDYDSSVIRCDAALLGMWFLMFWRNMIQHYISAIITFCGNLKSCKCSVVGL